RMERTRRFPAALTAVALAAMLALAGTAQARDRVVTMKTPPAPGPKQYDRVFVHEFGPASAGKVLVLMPGTVAGAGDFTLTAKYLTENIRGLQVWAIDRRTQALEDTSMFKAALRGDATLQQMFDYYLGWIDGATPPTHFNFKDGNSFP